jgi:hypothetical protein
MGIKMSEQSHSNYLAKKDLVQPLRVIIAAVYQEDVEGDNGMETKIVASFRDEAIKPAILNVTNRSCLVDAYGDDSDGWIDKPAEFYYDPSIMHKGVRKGGIRVRIPAGPAPARQVPAPTPGLLTYPQAIAACAAAGITKDELVAALKARGLTCYNAVRDTMMVQQMIADKARLAQPAADEDFGGTPGGDLDADGNPLPF